jgi:hypothetical protein
VGRYAEKASVSRLTKHFPRGAFPAKLSADASTALVFRAHHFPPSSFAGAFQPE